VRPSLGAGALARCAVVQRGAEQCSFSLGGLLALIRYLVNDVEGSFYRVIGFEPVRASSHIAKY
jgi:hypothetical protein